MKYRLVTTFIIVFLSLMSLVAQSAKVVSVTRTGSASMLQWSILDSNNGVVTTSAELPQSDTVGIALISNTSYQLHVSIDEVAETDTVLLTLLMANSPILVVISGVEEGDHSFNFYTGQAKPQLRIIGGADASINDVPWQVCVLPGDYLCGGSIISEKWIVTAAHCAFDNNDDRISATDFVVVAGTSTPFSAVAGKRYKVKNVYIHEAYTADYEEYDIALLELEEKIDLEAAQPIKLITADDIDEGALEPGVLGLVSGWGYTNVRNTTIASTLQKVHLPIVSSQAASLVWGEIDDSFLMAGYRNGNKDACSGDSGGPFVVEVDGEYKLAGVVSWGDSDCNSYGGYSRISTYESWIRSTSGISALGELNTPTGDDLICIGTTASDYKTELRENASNYQWQLVPERAGVITGVNAAAHVEWADGFNGEVKVKVRAELNGEVLNWAILKVKVAKETAILESPRSLRVSAGSDAKLAVVAQGTDLNYRWYKNNELVANAYESELTFDDINALDIGFYTVEVDGYCGVAQVSDSVYVFVKGKRNGLPEAINISSSMAGNMVTVAVNTAIPYSIKVYDRLGRQLLQKDDCVYDVTFSIANFVGRVFLLEVSSPVINGACKIIKHEN